MTPTQLPVRDDFDLHHNSPIHRFRSLTLSNSANVLRACSPYRTPQFALLTHFVSKLTPSFFLLARCLSVRRSGVPKVTKLSKAATLPPFFAAVLGERTIQDFPLQIHFGSICHFGHISCYIFNYLTHMFVRNCLPEQVGSKA